MRPVPRILTFALAAFTLAACDDAKVVDTTCKPSLTALAPTAKSGYEVNVGQIVDFHAEAKACNEGESFGVRWMLNDAVVGYSNDYSFVACSSDLPDGANAATMPLMAQAITYVTTDSATEEKVVATHKWNVKVVDIAKPTRPGCYEQSLADIVNTMDADDEFDGKKLDTAVTCLDAYLSTYACDFEASYASGLAKAGLLGESLYPLYLQRMDMGTEDIKKMVEERVRPIRQNFLVVQQKAPEDFSFFVDGNFKITIFEDDPNLRGDDTISVLMKGRHDKSDALFIMAAMNFFDAGINIGLANKGSIEFGLHTPDNENFSSGSKRLVSYLESDPSLFTLIPGVDGNGDEVPRKEGERLMKLSQNSLIQGLNQISAHLDSVRAETHDQANDIIRYWDCGRDGICPATCDYMQTSFNKNGLPDAAEYNTAYYANCEEADGNYDDRNLNGKCDEAWSKADAGECNQRYDEGESFGTNIAGFGSVPSYDRIGPAISLDLIQTILAYFRDNIRGPDALPLDSIGESIGFPARTVSNILKTFAVPYPEIRISEFFSTPHGLRELVPLYSKSAGEIILDLEAEPFDDTGYDGLYSFEEPGYDANDPEAVDPNKDDLDPYCNPHCNQADGIDNDGDGKVDSADRSGLMTKDLGVEANLVFDFVDLPGGDGSCNGLHDPWESELTGETDALAQHEPFKDVGTLDLNGNLIGKGNKVWDASDRAHEWPTGSDVGPVADLSREADVPNGALGEGGLVDAYYFFFQDPTFSGAVRFIADPYNPSQSINNANGQVLSDNARLHRFMSRALQIAVDFEVREGSAHPHWSCD